MKTPKRLWSMFMSLVLTRLSSTLRHGCGCEKGSEGRVIVRVVVVERGGGGVKNGYKFNKGAFFEHGRKKSEEKGRRGTPKGCV
jgi:hypothetical protein